MRALVATLALAGCAIHPTVEKTVENPVPLKCPTAPVVKVAPPPPVKPDSCVADWYAKATLPSCVEAYLTELKAQQKVIARNRKDAAR